MHSSPETTELNQIFKQLDKQNHGYLTQDQFIAFMEHQPRKVPHYLLNDLFNLLPDSKMKQQAFICYVMGYRMNLQHLAVARFALEKQFGKHAVASPSSGANELRKNSIKLSVASKKSLGGGEKHSISLKIGRDGKAQQQKFAELEHILDQKPDDIVGIIKFKVTGAHQQIRHGLETIIQTVKGILTEMDEQLFRIVDLFKISVKANGNYIYIIIQVGHVFLADCATFLNQLIQSINPEALINFQASIQSNYFKQFLKEGGEKKLEDLQVGLNLDIDNESLKKLKEIIATKIPTYNKQEQLGILLMLLFQQVRLDASFSDSQKLINKLGLNSILGEAKTELGSLKNLMIFETMEGFVPQSKEVIDNIKKYAKGDGQIDINFKHVYLSLEFNVEVEGFFDLF